MDSSIAKLLKWMAFNFLPVKINFPPSIVCLDHRQDLFLAPALVLEIYIALYRHVCRSLVEQKSAGIELHLRFRGRFFSSSIDFFFPGRRSIEHRRPIGPPPPQATVTAPLATALALTQRLRRYER